MLHQLEWLFCFLDGAPTSISHFFRPSVCPSVGPSRTKSQEPCNNYHNFWYTCIKWWYLQAFFHFSKILIFWAVRRVKGQKVAQNEKQQLHLSRAISQEKCSIWSWFLVHLCRMIISSGVFYFFVFFFHFLKILSFWVASGVKGQK